MEMYQKVIKIFPLLIIDNEYTKDYLKDFTNLKESIFKYLNLELTDDVFTNLINKYNLEPSNNLVDLLYEGLIYESNNNQSNFYFFLILFIKEMLWIQKILLEL